MRKRTKARLLHRLGAWALTLALVAGLLPQTAFATDTGKAIQLGTSGISDPTSTQNNRGTYYTPSDYVYFGVKGSDPIKWRVLDADKTNDGTTSGMFLLSEYLLDSGVVFESARTSDDNDGQINPNDWQHSDAQNWCSTFATKTDVFSTAEQAAFLGVVKTDSAERLYNIPWGVSSLTQQDKMFFLSARELTDYVGDYDGAPGLRATDTAQSAGGWWLRSPDAGSGTGYAGLVNSLGVMYSWHVDYAWAARPAFNLNRDSVLFTSAAEGGKTDSTVDGNLTEVAAYDGNEWKLTLLDSSRNFSVTEKNTSGNPGEPITLNYTGATTGTNEYISVLLTDQQDNALYYGRVAQPQEENGTVEVAIPTDLALGQYTLNVFNEQYNGNYKTDYASAFATVDLTVEDTIAPTLSGGSATRTSETTATVKFISDEAGEYFYEVVESDTEAPTIDTTGAGTACVSGENTISLTSLSGAGAKDIYIVAKDAIGNVSQSLKISIPEYIAPSYSISATPSALDFGSMTEDYSSAPAAQTVTIQNTGNQTITLNQPAADDFNVGALSATELTAGGTATFTVQPKTGLGVGDYSGMLTISGSNSTSASVALSFAVTDIAPTTYTLTVALNGGNGGTTGGAYAEGAVINIDAGSRSNYRFNGWTSSNGGTFADASSASTTFTMPANDTTITANWRYTGGGSSGGGSTGGGSGSSGSTTYVPSVDAGRNGDVTVSPSRPSSGQTVTITVDPDAGYALDDLTVTDARGNVVKVTDNGDGTYSFTQPSSKVTIEATFAEIQEEPALAFTDVTERDYYYDAVLWAVENGVTNGASSATFSPDANVSRAQMVTFLWRAAGSPEPQSSVNPFTDISSSAYYYDAVLWAVENGITNGTSATTFGPESAVSRAQAVTFLWRSASSPAASGVSFDDVADEAYYAQAVAWAAQEGITSGTGGNSFSPDLIVSRAQAVTFLYRQLG